ncbi:hypothetical protein NK718_13365 [Alsobacter sp. SYSU M60028]|uniref:Uncharacterized protein n=1 Tax=Alsobacter ponti TaxID=2962936 RepID=A0ABT1LDE0_9HYPH|nr:hypothetical protein [Alsobacter ponti]MCP8939509.1 hypothetical protein [Alsobacter ponti]
MQPATTRRQSRDASCVVGGGTVESLAGPAALRAAHGAAGDAAIAALSAGDVRRAKRILAQAARRARAEPGGRESLLAFQRLLLLVNLA